MAIKTRTLMSDELVIPDDICEQFLEKLAQNPGIGHVTVLRELGMQGSKGQIRAAIKRQLGEQVDATRRDSIRQELFRRGIDGWDEPIYQGGKLVGAKRVFSDACLIALAKMRLPEARDRLALTVAGPGGGPVQIEDRSATLADVARILEAAGALAQLGGGTGRADVPDTRQVLPALPPA